MRIEQDLIEETQLDEVISKVLTAMSEEECGSEQFGHMAEHLLKLYRAKEIDVKGKVLAFDSAAKQVDQDRLTEIREFEANQKKIENQMTLGLRQRELELQQMKLDTDRSVSELDMSIKQDTFEERRRISSDTLALIAANLGGILIIIGYERVNVIASKAIGFIMRR